MEIHKMAASILFHTRKTIAALLFLSTYLSAQTIISIEGENFVINGKPTYQGKFWKGVSIEGLLLNARMVQGIFDDRNPETCALWKYPDTGVWDAERNTNEFVSAVDDWHSQGLLAFTLNLQGGSPTGYGNKGWKNSAFDEHGGLLRDYFNRLEKILNKADSCGMIVILGLFYFGQDQTLIDESSVIGAVDNAVDWLFKSGHLNIIIEINNECDVDAYDHEILKPKRVHELILRVKQKTVDGNRFLVGTSFKGSSLPTSNVMNASDLILIHGNGVSDPAGITEMIVRIRQADRYRSMPIVFNEDDHFDFDKPANNFTSAVRAHASWGFFDYRLKKETDYNEGYQSIPVNWKISSDRKKSFFLLLKEMTGGY
jgi:hypothetical protein